jgi:protein involved in polysaccharide export with SLBB domain
MTSLTRPSPAFHSVVADASRRRQRRVTRSIAIVSAWVVVASVPSSVLGQNPASPLTSRDELLAAATQAEQSRNPVQAAALRQRLRDGDFQVGDRIILRVVVDTAHTDTLLVRAGRVIDLPGRAELPLTGVLRSEVKERVTAEVLKYVKAQEVVVTPLTRIAVFGEVAHPGYFAFRSDVPITDAIMLAGGPTAAADIERTVIKRGSREYRSAEETRQAVARGMTLDQLGLAAGDELVVGKQRPLINQGLLSVVGMAASLAAVLLAAANR